MHCGCGNKIQFQFYIFDHMIRLGLRKRLFIGAGFHSDQEFVFDIIYVSILISEPIITIHGGLERHIKYGSQINLTCQVRYYPEKLKYVIWYQDEKVSI